MRILDRIATAIVLLFGVGHVVATTVWAPGWNPAAAWFSGSGLALLFAGLLNLSRLLGAGEAPRRLCLIANILTLAWIGFIVAVLPVAQAFVAGGAVAVLTLASLTRWQAGARPSLR
jgi:hypothetical protein